MDYDFIIDQMRWSFSRLNSFYDGCRKEWYRNYIECKDKVNGFFGEYGGYVHEILEKYAKGELDVFELSQVYEEGFDEAIPHDAPPNKYTDIRQSYYEKGLEYFDNIDLDFDNYEILGVEKEVNFEIDRKPFIGYIDLLLREKESGKIIIVDHKSASIKFLKNGSVSKGDREHVKAFVRQLMLYSKSVIDEYGRVDECWWNLFRDRSWYKIKWTEEDYNEALQWASDTIKAIEKEEEWNADPESRLFYCLHLCSQRFDCPEKEAYMAEKYPPREDGGDDYYDPNQ